MNPQKLKYIVFCFLFSFCIADTTEVKAQQIQDSICITATEDFNLDLTVYGLNSPFLEQGSECFFIQGNMLRGLPGNCCGMHDLIILDEQGDVILLLFIEVKCPKPECYINDISDVGGDPSTGIGGPSLIYACSESVVTYFIPESIGSTYEWTTDQGDMISGPSSIDIIWNTPGSHTVTVSIYSGATLVNTITRDIEVLESPEANFTKSAACVCLGGDIVFDASTSIGASTYSWDMGDGNSLDGQVVNYSYDTPGTYTVILTVGANNYDEQGNPLCCCTDTMSMDIIVENEEGPPVYWVSTLCEGDSSIYWTDAECMNFIWEVTDASGAMISFDNISDDTIGVVWPSGPYGTISLQVSDCVGTYCSKPSIVQVPIISSSSLVVGDDVVCQGASENYSVPKWRGVTYDWSVTGGTLIADQNTATVIWDDPSATMGTVSVTYYNDFLSGLMMADSCIGTGSLDVDIRPRFDVLSDTTVCVGYTSMLSTDDASQAFTWSISPSGSYTVTTTGANSIDVTWTDPGVYVVTAVPVDPSVYCIESNTATIVVKDMPPPTGIEGEIEVCPEGLYYYTAVSDQSGVDYNWTITGGTPTTGTGNPLAIEWNPTAMTHSISLTQSDISEPGCESDPIMITVTLKEIDDNIIIDNTNGCTNQIQTYAVTGAQHADATVAWWIEPDTAGSVIDVIGQNTADIQWNNDGGVATIYYAVMLCGDTVTASVEIDLYEPQVATIVQIGTLCPGVPGMLEATAGLVNYEWSTGDNGPTNSTIILTPGTYTLTTTDSNGCTDVTAFEAIGSPLPVASISTNDRIICIDTITTPPPMPPNDIEIRALTAPSYEYQWECGGSILVLPPSTASIIHSNTYVPGTFNYRVTVTDTNTGCTDVSNTLQVVQDYCDTCDVDQHMIDITAVQDPTYCNIFTFSETHSANVGPTSWSFADGTYSGYSGPTITHTYTSAGDYDPEISGLVYGQDTCSTNDFVQIEVPLAPYFTYSDSCLKVQFDDYSSHIIGESIVGYSWDFGDGNIATDPSPCHTYGSSGTYTVELTIEGASGCLAIYSDTIIITVGASPTISLSPSPACIGEAVLFTGSHPGTIVDWFWDFGDGSYNGAQVAEHSYATMGTYMVSLTTLSAEGCETTSTASIYIKPNPDAMGINASGPLEFCEGDNVTLSVTSAGSVSYNWSTGDNMSSITVGATGTYNVTVTENGCDTILGPIDVFVFPEINTTINGENYICENECITLTAPSGTGYMYQWLDDTGDPIPFQTGQTYTACFNTHPPYVAVAITDDNGCTSVSDLWYLESGLNPSLSTTTIGDECAGSVNVLIANVTTPGMTNADVTFAWSNGQTGNSITTSTAGQHTVTAVHNVTGCIGTAIFVINPLPDFCILPSGCYTVCNPDTLYGPPGLAMYQWNKDGVPIPAPEGTGQDYYITMSGSYSLTGTTSDGCTSTSDTLIIEVKNCYDCEDTHVSAKETIVQEGGDCCYEISYVMNFDSIIALDISTDDADVGIYNVGADYALLSNAGGNALIGSTAASGHLAQGSVVGAFDLCLTNVTSSPQEVVFSWIHENDGTVCTDTLLFECPVSTDCAYISDLSIDCEGDDQVVTFNLCNPSNALFDIGYFSIFTSGGIDFGLVDLEFDITGSPILPGDCATFSAVITEPGLEYEELCLGVIVHSDDPDEVPDALCCTTDSLWCAIVPGCSPCELTYATATRDTSTTDCCYDVTIVNDYDLVFTDIHINSISAGTTISFDNPLGSPWTPSNLTSTGVELHYDLSEVPLGPTSVPSICVTDTDSEYQLIEILWLAGDDVLCIDTLTLRCDPPCGYMISEKDNIICNDDGTWVYYGVFTNTSPFTISELHISFPVGSGLEVYNQTIIGLSVPPLGSFGPITLPIGAPAVAGDELCFNVTMHTIDADGNTTSCCVFTHCIVLPDCEIQEECLCDATFEDEVEMGILCDDLGDFMVSIIHAGDLLPCDEVTYSINGDDITTLAGGQGFSFIFPGPGTYEICIRVVRTADDGKQCKAKYCKKMDIEQDGIANIAVYPNPSLGAFTIDLEELKIDSNADVRIVNAHQQIVKQMSVYAGDDKQIRVEDTDLQNGVYIVLISNEGQLYRKNILIIR